MNEDIYFENHCESCGGGVEFPANGVGEQIPCPHCQRLITLSFPADANSNATKQIQAYLATSSFPTKRAELRLLRHYASPGQVSDLRELETWANNLGEDPKAVVDRFVSDGLLHECNSDLVQLLQTKSSSELKSMAAAMKIPVSGTKETLAKRLFKANPAGMRELFYGKTYLTCTPRGTVLVAKFCESEKEIRDSEREIQKRAELKTFSVLTEGRLKDACILVASFKASRVFPPDPGIDWNKNDCDRDLIILQNIFSTQLKRLASLDQNDILRLRIAASMMQLWGENDPSPWLPNDGLDRSAESRMLFFAALSVVRLEEMKQAGIKRVEVLGSANTCSTCRSENGKKYPINAAPVLPHESCRCKTGCGCLLLAIE